MRDRRAYDREASDRDAWETHRPRLYRNVREGKIAGVCAGFADYFGWNLKWTRILWTLGAVFFAPAPIVAYIAFAVFLPRDAPIGARYPSPDDERFWREFARRPRIALSDIKHRFRQIDSRLADMERVVVSEEYGLRRAFDDLENSSR